MENTGMLLAAGAAAVVLIAALYLATRKKKKWEEAAAEVACGLGFAGGVPRPSVVWKDGVQSFQWQNDGIAFEVAGGPVDDNGAKVVEGLFSARFGRPLPGGLHVHKKGTAAARGESILTGDQIFDSVCEVESADRAEASRILGDSEVRKEFVELASAKGRSIDLSSGGLEVKVASIEDFEPSAKAAAALVYRLTLVGR